MRVFEHPNFVNNTVCPICKTNHDRPCVLIPIMGTGDGNTYEARQYHLDCIDLFEMTNPSSGDVFIIQQVDL